MPRNKPASLLIGAFAVVAPAGSERPEQAATRAAIETDTGN